MHCLLLVPRALPGDSYAPGVSSVPRRELKEEFLIGTSLSLLTVLLPQHVFGKGLDPAGSFGTSSALCCIVTSGLIFSIVFLDT